MKLILLLIFYIVCFNLISSININSSDIFKGINSKLKIKKIRGEVIKRYKIPKKDILQTSKLSNKFRRIIDPKCSVFKNGSLFMACCVKGGISPAQFSNACHWALKNNYIKDENHLNMSKNDFSKKIAQQFQTKFHSDWKIVGPTIKGHHEVINSKKQIIFNSNGLKNHSY